MSVPYTPGFTANVLASMSDEQLAEAAPIKFRMWPAPHPLDPAIARDLIAQERARRQKAPAT